MIAERAALAEAARVSIARGSKSFAAASTLFAPDVRERAWLLYAWCRACDDLVDGQDHGGERVAVTDAQARVARVRALSVAALAGQPTGDPAFDALGVVAAETRMPPAYVHDLIDGFQLDADDWRPAGEDDLYRYCYHVAGAVGCMMAIVMGVPPEDDATLDRACDLGLAFQLANIARDLDEDARAGRCYLPQAWLAQAGVAADAVMAPANRDALVAMARRLADRAALHEDSARVGTRALSWRSAWAVLAAAGIYGDIARTVSRRGAHAWDRRVTTGKAAKLAWIARAAAQATRRHAIPDTPRDPVLWTRPR